MPRRNPYSILEAWIRPTGSTAFLLDPHTVGSTLWSYKLSSDFDLQYYEKLQRGGTWIVDSERLSFHCVLYKLNNIFELDRCTLWSIQTWRSTPALWWRKTVSPMWSRLSRTAPNLWFCRKRCVYMCLFNCVVFLHSCFFFCRYQRSQYYLPWILHYVGGWWH